MITNGDFTDRSSSAITADASTSQLADSSGQYPWWMPAGSDPAIAYGYGIGPDLLGARVLHSSPVPPNFGPAISGNVFVKETVVVSDPIANDTLAFNKFISTNAGHRYRVTFYVRAVVAPAEFTYRFFTTGSGMSTPIIGLSTSAWTKVQSYLGSTYTVGGLAVEQSFSIDPVTAQPILQSQRGAIAISNVSVEDCGTFNPGCVVSAGGATVCGIQVTNDLPPGFGYIKNVRSSEYLTSGSPATINNAAVRAQQWKIERDGTSQYVFFKDRDLNCLQVAPAPVRAPTVGSTLNVAPCNQGDSLQRFVISDTVSVSRTGASTPSAVYRIRPIRWFDEYAGATESDDQPGLQVCLTGADNGSVALEQCDDFSHTQAQAWTFEAGPAPLAPIPIGNGDFVANWRDTRHRAIGRLLAGTYDASTDPQANNVTWGAACTATLVRRVGDPSATATVVTAAHCLSGQVYAFTPAFNEFSPNSTPYGMFFAGAGDLLNGNPGNSASPDPDFAFVNFSRQYLNVDVNTGWTRAKAAANSVTNLAGTGLGAKIAETPGLNGLKVTFRPSAQQDVDSYGYPASIGNGRRLAHTKSPTTWLNKTIEYRTLMAGGASGGPSLIGDNVVGVRSKGSLATGSGGILATSTLLLGSAENLYNQAITGA